MSTLDTLAAGETQAWPATGVEAGTRSARCDSPAMTCCTSCRSFRSKARRGLLVAERERARARFARRVLSMLATFSGETSVETLLAFLETHGAGSRASALRCLRAGVAWGLIVVTDGKVDLPPRGRHR